MANSTVHFTAYRIKPNLNGRAIGDFDDAIDQAALATSELESFDPVGDDEFSTKLYLMAPPPKVPDWIIFLRQGFPEAEVPPSVANRAVLMAKLRNDGKDHYFAFTFGLGRYLLNNEVYERHFGLTVVLRAADMERVRRVGKKTVREDCTMYESRQAGREIPFDRFGFRPGRDVLRSVAAASEEKKFSGVLLSANDAISFNRSVLFSSLKAVCQELVDAYGDGAAPKPFTWVNDFQIITAPDLIRTLSDKVVALIRGDDTGRHTLDLAPPEFIDFSKVAHFRFSFLRAAEHSDVSLEQYISTLTEADRFTDLDLESLRSRHIVEAVDESGECIDAWSVFRCLTGGIRHEHTTYVLEDGDFYLIDRNYLRALNAYIESVPQYTEVLPKGREEQTEGEYNDAAADARSKYLLLDRKTVRISNRTSSIEICDLLSNKGDLIHVKRKLSSSSLSHLFAQGFVSADLLVRNPEYRREVRKKVQAAVSKKLAAVRPSFNDLLDAIDPDGITARDYRIVYAVIAKWNGRSLVDAMPFFSKVNLREHIEDLKAMGYKVAFAKIQGPAPVTRARAPRGAPAPATSTFSTLGSPTA